MAAVSGQSRKRLQAKGGLPFGSRGLGSRAGMDHPLVDFVHAARRLLEAAEKRRARSFPGNRRTRRAGRFARTGVDPDAAREAIQRVSLRR